MAQVHWHREGADLSHRDQPFVTEGVSFSAALIVYEEGLLSSLCSLTPCPRHVPLLALHPAIEHIMFLAQDTSGFERIISQSIEESRASSLPGAFHRVQSLGAQRSECSRCCSHCSVQCHYTNFYVFSSTLFIPANLSYEHLLKQTLQIVNQVCHLIVLMWV